MSESIREAVLAVLGTIAPEADLGALEPDAELREELEIDSLDLLNFAVGIEERTGIAIPESDYARVATLAACVAYLEERASS